MDEVAALRAACHDIVEEMDPADVSKSTFDTRNNEKTCNEYFLSSGDKIRFFFEKEALDETGNLVVDKHNSLNKVGHALHTLSPPFKKVTHSKKVQDIARNLGFVKPDIAASMYIFKPPRIGGEVAPHQDGIFLDSTPLKVLSYWIALEDADIDNSCLQFIPGSNSRDISTRLKRKLDGPGVFFDGGPFPLEVTDEDFVPVPVKAGMLVLIDARVIHRSSKNSSDRSRHIYSFAITETENTEWSQQNWVVPTAESPFQPLYTKE